MYWDEVAIFAVVLTVCVVRGTNLHLVDLVYSLAPVSTCYWL
jgi:hypothetical protein